MNAELCVFIAVESQQLNAIGSLARINGVYTMMKHDLCSNYLIENYYNLVAIIDWSHNATSSASHEHEHCICVSQNHDEINAHNSLVSNTYSPLLSTVGLIVKLTIALLFMNAEW